MSLGYPLALLGLVGLLAPLVIHLLQRGHQTTIEISTTQFVPVEQRPEWRWSRLREPLLWALRSMLVVAAVILLAEPLTRSDTQPEDTAGYTLVSTQVDADTAAALVNDTSTLLWLAPDLPSLETAPPPWRPGQLWGLLWHADQTLPADKPLRVIAPARSGEVDAVRPVLGRSIEWMDAPATKIRAPTLSLTVVHDEDRAANAARITLVEQAWQVAGLDVTLQQTTPANVSPQARSVVWLSSTPWSESLAMDAPGLIVTDAQQSPRTGRVLFRDGRRRPAVIESIDGARTVRQFTYKLDANSRAFNSPEFALLLAQTALPALMAPPPDLPLDAATRIAPTTQNVDTPAPTRTRAPVWINIVLLLAALERLVAALYARRAAT
jgi:hypothetical protein